MTEKKGPEVAPERGFISLMVPSDRNGIFTLPIAGILRPIWRWSYQPIKDGNRSGVNSVIVNLCSAQITSELCKGP